jgi:hypothetical protein
VDASPGCLHQLRFRLQVATACGCCVSRPALLRFFRTARHHAVLCCAVLHCTRLHCSLIGSGSAVWLCTPAIAAVKLQLYSA